MSIGWVMYSSYQRGWKAPSKEDEKKYKVDKSLRTHVYLDIKINNQDAGKIILELYNDITPKTAENFRSLCTGEKGKTSEGELLNFRSSKFHRIIPGFMIQG